jgi:hypothetical protein
VSPITQAAPPPFENIDAVWRHAGVINPSY